MNNLWNITIEEYFEIVEIAKKLGLNPGDSMEEIIIAYMKVKGKKSCGITELNKSELVKEYLSHNKKVMEMNVNVDGKTTYKITKNKDSLDNG